MPAACYQVSQVCSTVSPPPPTLAVDSRPVRPTGAAHALPAISSDDLFLARVEGLLWCTVPSRSQVQLMRSESADDFVDQYVRSKGKMPVYYAVAVHLSGASVVVLVVLRSRRMLPSSNSNGRASSPE